MSDQPQSPDAGRLLVLAIDGVTEQVDAITDADWEKPTPCEGWDVHRLVDHVTDTLVGIRGALAGTGYRESKYGDLGRTHDTRDTVTTWHQQAEHGKEAAEQLASDPVVKGPMGEGPASQALKVPTHDLTVHAWDLAAACGRDYEIPDELLDDMERLVHSFPEEVLRSPGLFGPEVEAPEGASRTERAMAFLGRRRPDAG